MFFSDLELPLAIGLSVGGLFLIGALCLALYRVIAGPTAFDRVIALDLIGGICLSIIVLFAIAFEQSVLIEASLAIAVVSFMGTIALARYLAGGGGPQS